MFLVCISLNQSWIGKKSFRPLLLSILSMIAIYLILSLTKSSSRSCPTTSLFLPSLEWSLTIIVPILPCSASSIISINAGLVKVVPEYPSSTKNLIFWKLLSFAYLLKIDFWFVILLLSPESSSSLDKRQYKAVILSLSSCFIIFSFLWQLEIRYKIIVSTFQVVFIIYHISNWKFNTKTITFGRFQKI